MPHQHSHSNKGLTLAFWLNLFFSIIELFGGLLTNSTAIIADAFHDFMDAVAIGGAVLLEKVALRKRTPKYSYGYKRFSLLSALILSVILLVGAVLMVIGAVQSFLNPKVVNSMGMLWLAVLGIVINGFAFLKIRYSGSSAHDHHHSHGHDHSHGHSHNTKAVMLHLLEDVLGWIAVLIGAIVIYFTHWFWIDGLLAIAIAIFIGYNSISNLLGTMNVLLQSVPKNVDVEKLNAALLGLDGIANVHDLHVWSLDGSYNVASVHAVIKPSHQTKESDLRASIVSLMETHQIQHPTVQIETLNSSCKLEHC